MQANHLYGIKEDKIMKMSMTNRRLIKRAIKKYEQLLKTGNDDGSFMSCSFCPFCAEYRILKRKISYCNSKCPNYKINNLLGIKSRDSFACLQNSKYFAVDEVKFRKELWQDFLSLSEKEFIKKYKR